MGVLRSEKMKSGTLILPVERARHFVNIIGSNVNLEFRDENENALLPNRPYKKYVERISEMERHVRYLQEEISKYKARYVEERGLSDSDAAEFLVVKKDEVENFLQSCDLTYKMDAVEGSLKQSYTDFVKFAEHNSQLLDTKNKAIEEACFLQVAIQTYSNLQVGGTPIASNTVFSNIAGVLNLDEQDKFARFVFRLTHGNTFTYFQPIEKEILDSKSGKNVKKCVFIVYFQDMNTNLAVQHGGGRADRGAMHAKVMQACKAFGVHTYEIAADATAGVSQLQTLQARLNDAQARIADATKTLHAYDNYILQEIELLLYATPDGHNSLIEEYRMFCQKEKACYACLNMFEGEGALLRCDVWYPEAEEDDIRRLLITNSHGVGQTGASAMLVADRVMNDHIARTYHGEAALGGAGGHDEVIHSKVEPPTYFKGNDFTNPTMEMVFTYGIPRYQEATPVLMSLVTFPFIFGVMYGDIGHGGIIFSAGLYFCFYCDPKQLAKSQPLVYLVRWMLLLMGFFAFYAGFMYNDFFSTGTNFFGSRWQHSPLDAHHGVAHDGSASHEAVVEKQMKIQGSFIKARSTSLHNGTHHLHDYELKHSSLLQMKQHNVSVKAVSTGRKLMAKESGMKGEKNVVEVPSVGKEEHKEVTHHFIPNYDIYNNGSTIFYDYNPQTDKNDVPVELAYASPYPFGIDPAWHGSSNELLYMNSLKMKISVLFGVVQMTVGLMFRFSNAIYEKNKIDLFFECIPMTIFMIGYFGYMCWMILYKWVTPGMNLSIINSLISMSMQTGGADQEKFSQWETVLMMIVVCSVPLLLIPKPVLLYLQHRQALKKAQLYINQSGEEDPFDLRNQQQGLLVNASSGGGAVMSDPTASNSGNTRNATTEKRKAEQLTALVPHFELGEVVIHQLIETIEYTLGTVSHTASYLRQWALSLSHQQLSLVFFQYTLQSAFMLKGGIVVSGLAIFLAFGMWAGVTCAVILGMDFLECTLHTLRLHWVEFQSKFYHADGRLFKPFRHDKVLAED